MKDVADAGRNSILVAGIPRSGTTWVGRVLGQARGAYFLNEPDSHVNQPFAVRAKRKLGRYPMLGANEIAPHAYEQLWQQALIGEGTPDPLTRVSRRLRRRLARRILRTVSLSEIRSAFPAWNPRLPLRLELAGTLGVPRRRPPWASHLVVKSVRGALALEWIHECWRPRVAIVLRNPLNVIASWVELGYSDCRLDEHPLVVDRYLRPWGIAPPDPSASSLARVAWEVGFLTWVLENLAERHRDWKVVVHEQVCENPLSCFEALFGDLGLEWNEAAESLVRRSNRPGRRYETNRIAKEQISGWRRRLTPEQVSEIRPILTSFPSLRWSWRRELNAQ